jgi:putative glycosyltransferase (TIGR04348 family)
MTFTLTCDVRKVYRSDHHMNIAIVMPDSAAARSGNQHTARRWAGFLRDLGHRVVVSTSWQDSAADMLIALHARKSAASALAFHRQHPQKPLIVTLTGTDLYRDIHDDAHARHSLEIASRLVVLQEQGRLELMPALRGKTRVIYQSARVALRQAAVKTRFRIAVVGHLREEKDPFRTVQAITQLQSRRELEIVHIGAALNPSMRREAMGWMRRDERYRWLDSLPHHRALRWLASSHLLVVSSVMEGGANVICEAARIGVPVLASRVPGNIGMLGARYPGYFDLHDATALAAAIEDAATDVRCYRRLAQALRARRHLFAPAAERASLGKLIAGCGG